MMHRHIGISALFLILTVACVAGQTVGDSGGHIYAVKLMSDGRTWTTENLRIALPGSYCYRDGNAECLRFGRLYTWASATEVCERLGTGWRLPTEAEWRQLAAAYGGTLAESDGRAAFSDLLSGGRSGFNAVLGGDREALGGYARLGDHGFYWTATQSDAEHAWFYNFGRGGGVLNRHPDGDKSMAVSVRCVEAP